jgi:uncharacterized protein (TIGR02466 family)|tara:strand:+ start:1440 stop:2039 length:600 start_codon:yes stop_codon:yes gene_type:complete
MQHKVYSLFATNIGVFQIDIDCNKYLKIIEKEDYNLSDPNKSNLADISKNNKLFNNKKYKPLENKFKEALDMYAYKYLEYKCDLNISNSWSTRTKSKKESSLHNHSNSFLSGVFYLQEETSPIYFENFNKPHFNVPLQNPNIRNSQFYTLDTRPGLLLIFPSGTYHKILENKSNKTRYSIAFNVLPKGKIGSCDNELIL